MDDPREFLKEAAAAEEPEVFGHMRAEMTRIRASLPAEGTPLGDVGKVPSAAEFLKEKEPDDLTRTPITLRYQAKRLGNQGSALRRSSLPVSRGLRRDSHP